MTSPAKIIRALGINAVAARLEVSPSRVRRVTNEKLIPAKWYVGMKELADRAGVELPVEVFAFDGIDRGEG